MAEETYLVRFANREAVQKFQEGRDILVEVLADMEWNDELKRAAECFDDAWDGLSFSVNKE